jgi:predicted nucleic acid-binding protein
VRRGTKQSPLPNFFICAHAAVAGYLLLTRDVARYRTYFPRLKLIAPDYAFPSRWRSKIKRDRCEKA